MYRVTEAIPTQLTGEPRVHERDGGLEDALVGAGQVDEHRDGRVDARGVLRVQVRLICAQDMHILHSYA